MEGDNSYGSRRLPGKHKKPLVGPLTAHRGDPRGAEAGRKRGNGERARERGRDIQGGSGGEALTLGPWSGGVAPGDEEEEVAAEEEGERWVVTMSTGNPRGLGVSFMGTYLVEIIIF